MRFAAEYVEQVLTDNFEDAKRFFIGPLLAIHSAHLVMLAERRIISADEARALRAALDSISEADIQRATYDGVCEDLFFHVDRMIASVCGETTAGRLHTARSRNDIDMTMYRMRQRELVLGLLAASLDLRAALLDVAARGHEMVFAAHTHTQRAQPTTIAHYMLAVVEQLERDAIRLKGAYERTNLNPLGSCAITGTGFPIDRQLTADLLGFQAPTGNTYGSIATVDYLLESASAAAVLLVGLGRFLQDLLLWGTSEFGYVRFGDGYVQSSSIMPQKRNPVAIEHARAIGSKALGQSQAILMTVHNTPFGDIVDTEDDLQPLVFSTFRDATRAVKLVAAAMASAEFDRGRLEAAASEGWTTLTELADTLVRDHGVSFRKAHTVAARLVAASKREPARSLADLLAEASREVLGSPLRYSDAALAEILSARHFVAVRQTPGGPAPDVTRRAAEASRGQLEIDREWLKGTRAALSAAGDRLSERSSRL
jgi:argininosuccinate lyase